MKAKRCLALLLGILLLTLPLAGCKGEEETSEPVLVVATPPPREAITTLNIVIPQTVDTLHPLLATQREVRSMLGLVFESLITYDDTGMPVGALAASLEPDEAAKVWTIKLRTQAVWQGTNRAISADDVIFTLDLIRSIGKNDPYGSVLDYISGWEKVDETTVKIVFVHGFLGNQMALDFPILPYDGGYTQKTAPNPAVGTGPYVMGKLNTGESLTLKANPKWWKKQPAITTITAHRFENAETAATSLMLRQLDAMQSDALVTEQYSYAGDVNTYQYVTPYFEFLAFNMASEKVADARFRQAIALGLDRKSIVSAVYMNHATLCDTPYFPGNAMLKADAARDSDAEKAKLALAAMGWKKETELTLLVCENREDTTRMQTADLIARQLAELGVTVKVKSKNTEEFAASLENGEYDLLLAGWYMGSVPDLSFALSSNGKGNVMNYHSDEMDRRLNAFLISGQDGFDSTLADIKSLLAEDVPLISLFFRNHTLLTSAEVKGVGRVDEDNAFGSIDQWIVNHRD